MMVCMISIVGVSDDMMRCDDGLAGHKMVKMSCDKGAIKL